MSIDMKQVNRKAKLDEERLKEVYDDIRRLFVAKIERGGGTISGYDIDCVVAKHGLNMLPRNNGILGKLVAEFPHWEIRQERADYLPCVDYKVIRKKDQKMPMKEVKGKGKFTDFGGAYASPRIRIPDNPTTKYESFLVIFSDDGEVIGMTPVKSN